MKSLKFFVIIFFSLSMALLMSSCEEGEPDGGILDPGPIFLDCNYFEQGEDRILVNDPDRAVDYVVPCRAKVKVDIIVEVGTVIEFESAAGFRIEDDGSLSAVGTTNEMIVFTGVDKSRGSWAGIYFGSDDNNNKLAYCHINYAGGTAFNTNGNIASIMPHANSKLSVNNCIIENSPSYGIGSDFSSVHFNSLENNLFKNNDTPIFAMSSVIYSINKNNRFEGNTNSYVEVGANDAFTNPLAGNESTWQELDVPYRIAATDSGITRNIVIPNEKYLILEPGVELIFSANTGITIKNGGAFKAAGIEGGKQIRMTGAEEIPGFWGGIDFRFTNDPRNEVSNATLEYGAGADWGGVIHMWADPTVNVYNVTFSGLLNCAFYDGPATDNCFCNENLTESNNDFEDAGSAYCYEE